MRKSIFPDLFVEDNCISTYLRKKHSDGKYYLVPIRKSYRPTNKTDTKLSLEQYYREIYLFMILGIVNPTMIDSETLKNIHELDENQQEESERLTTYYHMYANKDL